jgi:hypothetical protein
MAPASYYDDETGDEEEEAHLEIEHIVSIYPYLPLLGFFAATLSFCFCLGLVMVQFWTRYDGSLAFISNGMDVYCGWSSAVLCSCGLYVGLCEFVAALHTPPLVSGWLIFAVLLQIPSWYIIIGVSGTGWYVHYAALLCFMVSTFYFHWRFATTHTVAHQTRIYHKANLITALNLVALFMAFLVYFATKPEPLEPTSAAAEEEDVSTTTPHHQFTKDIAVSLEVTLLCCITSQTFCLSWVLLQYQNIHLLFEPAKPTAAASA